MNVFECLATSLAIGIFAAICAYLSKHPLIKPLESELGSFRKLGLYLIRILHYFVAAFIFLYTFFVETSLLYDTFVLGFVVAIYLHWQVLDGCILSIFERSLLNCSRESFPNCYLEVFYIPTEIVRQIHDTIWIPFAILVMRIIYELYSKNIHVSVEYAALNDIAE